MKNDKILCWINRELLHFGVTKFLKEKTDCELFAIIEISEKPKKFFEEQKLVNFSKKWFFHDNVSIKKQKANLGYLESIEEKYDINLWQIAYAERLFLHYNKYHIFKREEILSLFEQEIKLYEKILDECNPDFFLVRYTDFHHNHLLYEICKARGIKILMLTPSRFGSTWRISQDDDIIEHADLDVDNHIEKKYSMIELRKFLFEHHSINDAKKNIQKRKKSSNKFLKKEYIKSIFDLFSYKNSELNRFMNVGRTRRKIIVKMLPLFLKTKMRKNFIDKTLLKKIPLNEKFIFFPLHYEPERVLLLGAPFYTNQIDVITKIAKSIPIDYKLYVKEHPVMGANYWRSKKYYQKIMSLPNVRLFHPDVNPNEIIKKSSLVISIKGTASIEAAFHNKPSIIFADMIFSDLSSIYRLKRIEDLPKIIKEFLQKDVNLDELNKLVSDVKKNTFHLDKIEIGMDPINPFSEAATENTNISEKRVSDYLEKYSTTFDSLAEEFKKKIQSYKEH